MVCRDVGSQEEEWWSSCLCRPQATEPLCVTGTPQIDDTLAQLSGATTFSKLDANSGFWQVSLSESSTFYHPLWMPLL